MKQAGAGLTNDVCPAGEHHRPVDQQPEHPWEPRLAGPKWSYQEDLTVLLLHLGEDPRDQRTRGEQQMLTGRPTGLIARPSAMRRGWGPSRRRWEADDCSRSEQIDVKTVHEPAQRPDDLRAERPLRRTDQTPGQGIGCNVVLPREVDSRENDPVAYAPAAELPCVGTQGTLVTCPIQLN